jgi:hypothetical protein
MRVLVWGLEEEERNRRMDDCATLAALSTPRGRKDKLESIVLQAMNYDMQSQEGGQY